MDTFYTLTLRADEADRGNKRGSTPMGAAGLWVRLLQLNWQYIGTGLVSRLTEPSIAVGGQRADTFGRGAAAPLLLGDSIRRNS